MSDDLYEVDPYEQKENEQTTKNKVLTYALIAFWVILGIFILFWMMMRMNYKVNAVRSEFRPTMKMIFIVVVVFVVLIALVMFLINIVGKKWAYDQNFVKEKKEIIKKEVTKK